MKIVALSFKIGILFMFVFFVAYIPLVISDKLNLISDNNVSFFYILTKVTNFSEGICKWCVIFSALKYVWIKIQEYDESEKAKEKIKNLFEKSAEDEELP